MMPAGSDDAHDYADGVSDVLLSAFGAGLLEAAAGGERGANPHPVDSLDWQEWHRGFSAWEDAPRVTIEIPDDHPAARFLIPPLDA